MKMETHDWEKVGGELMILALTVNTLRVNIEEQMIQGSGDLVRERVKAEGWLSQASSVHKTISSVLCDKRTTGDLCI